MQILQLPRDVINYTACFLIDTHDLAIMTRLSKTWKQIMDVSPAWQACFMHRFGFFTGDPPTGGYPWKKLIQNYNLLLNAIPEDLGPKYSPDSKDHLRLVSSSLPKEMRDLLWYYFINDNKYRYECFEWGIHTYTVFFKILDLIRIYKCAIETLSMFQPTTFEHSRGMLHLQSVVMIKYKQFEEIMYREALDWDRNRFVSFRAQSLKAHMSMKYGYVKSLYVYVREVAEKSKKSNVFKMWSTLFSDQNYRDFIPEVNFKKKKHRTVDVKYKTLIGHMQIKSEIMPVISIYMAPMAHHYIDYMPKWEPNQLPDACFVYLAYLGKCFARFSISKNYIGEMKNGKEEYPLTFFRSNPEPLIHLESIVRKILVEMAYRDHIKTFWIETTPPELFPGRHIQSLLYYKDACGNFISRESSLVLKKDPKEPKILFGEEPLLPFPKAFTFRKFDFSRI